MVPYIKNRTKRPFSTLQRVKSLVFTLNEHHLNHAIMKAYG